jgi:Flp pilus assembly protein TadD
MFIALAREADLEAHYQVVDVPPTWDADSGFLIRYTHINVVLPDVRLDRLHGDSVIFDFNLLHPDPENRRHIVSDDYAESLFHANRSVTLMRANRTKEGFAHMRRAIELAPDNVDHWINLGAMYATQNDYGSAQEAYQVVLQIDPRDRAALSGLARSYANAGDGERAAHNERKVRNYRERNPYYHSALAQAAFHQADFQRSLEHIDSAIDLRARTPRFHLFKALVEERLGHPDAARASFRRAERFGLDREVKLDLLQALATASAS